MKTHKLLTGLFVALFACSAGAQTELKFGHVGEPGSLFAKSAEEFAKRANQKLGGKAKVVTEHKMCGKLVEIVLSLWSRRRVERGQRTS